MKQRPLWLISEYILADWAKISPEARPYLVAMRTLNNVNDKYGLDSADEIVLRFLSNASTWRGEQARLIKAELKAMLTNKV